jgi:hypothetical protein
MKSILFTVVAALILSACARIPNTSQVIIARPLLDRSTIGGPAFPVVVRGAESVGLSEVALAQSLQFPPRIGGFFEATQESPNLINHAHLDIANEGANATATLTFLHGERRTGAGVFTLDRAAFSDPRTVGAVSQSLIRSMLVRAANTRRSSDEIIWIPW